MCNVKYGSNIKNLNDVQNLIIAIINRQQDQYNKGQIYEMVEYNYQGAEYDMSVTALREMVDDNLNFLYGVGLINCWNGLYTPQVIKHREIQTIV